MLKTRTCQKKNERRQSVPKWANAREGYRTGTIFPRYPNLQEWLYLGEGILIRGPGLGRGGPLKDGY